MLITLVVQPNEAGMRLDAWLVSRLPDASLAQVRAAIAEDRVRVASRTGRKPDEKLYPGDEVGYEPGDEAPVRPIPPPELPMPIAFEDEHLAALDKPAGMHVSGPRASQLAVTIARRLGSVAARGEGRRPGIVGAVDPDVSGLVLVARSRNVHEALTTAAVAGKLERTYVARVHGERLPDRGRIDVPIAPHPIRRMQFVGAARGAAAETRWRVRGRADGVCTVELTTRTDVLHQLRVHLAEHGHAIVGDRLYGRAGGRGGAKRLALHLATLRLVHPGTRKRTRLDCPVGDRLDDLHDLVN